MCMVIDSVFSYYSRYVGASILVVKGERNLRTCGMLKHNQNKAKATGIYLPEAEQQVKKIGSLIIFDVESIPYLLLNNAFFR